MSYATRHNLLTSQYLLNVYILQTMYNECVKNVLIAVVTLK
jgi:hypothetical protein